MPVQPAPEQALPPAFWLDGLERQTRLHAGPAGHPIDHHVAEPPPGSCTEISLGARGLGHGHCLVKGLAVMTMT